MRCKNVFKVVTWMIVFITLCSFTCILSPVGYADDSSIAVEGRVFFSGENDNYDIPPSSQGYKANARYTYGVFTVLGDLFSDGEKDGIPSYAVNDGNVSLIYTYSDTLRDAPEDQAHLFDDSSKIVNGIKLDSPIKKGAIIVQTSKDGERWMTDVKLTNAFAETQENVEPIYVANNVQLSNGCYYRVIVAFETRDKNRENQVLFVKTGDYSYRKTAELYEFYLHYAKQGEKDNNTPTMALGQKTRAAKENNGYFGSKTIGIDDPHYGWELGQFFVSGYTRATKDDSGTPVFLKTVGDKITLWFNLQQDIDKLHGKDTLSIADDDKGYDQYFQTEKMDMERGTLIVRYTDEKGNPHQPEIYTNYLVANATTSADTVVRLFEEGDYEVALDYKIKSVPRKVVGVEVIPEYSDYRIYFKFSVRNGNCMVYPFDVVTGEELTDESITPNGFKLDMAKSRYLTIDVQYAQVTPGANGYVEDVRFNRPAKDGDAYTDEGIYTFSVKNLYTNESTTKKIYVGDADYIKALSHNNLSVSELNRRVASGATIDTNGVIVTPTPEPTPTPTPTPEEISASEVDQTPTPTPTLVVTPAAQNATDVQPQVKESKGETTSIIPTIIIAAIAITAAVFFIKKRKSD